MVSRAREPSSALFLAADPEFKLPVLWKAAPSMLPTILKGATTHNLKGVDLVLEPGRVIAITGVSGSGKSSLALDTLYSEGQRRFVESFSPYARQFLERLERPPVLSLDPVSAGIAVDRKAPIKSSRSTLATMADLEPYLSALFLREALPVCPAHGCVAVRLDPNGAAQSVLERWPGRRAVVSYPLSVPDVDAYLELRQALLRDGYTRWIIQGEVRDLEQLKPSEVLGAKNVGVVLDRLALGPNALERLASALETGWNRSAVVEVTSDGETLRLPRGICCPVGGEVFEAPRPGLFSYASPLGACPRCRGFGRTLGIDLEKVIPDQSLSLKLNAIRPWRGGSTTWERDALKKLCQRHKIAWDRPFRELSTKDRERILSGDGEFSETTFPGVMGWFAWLETRTYKMHVRVLLSRYRSYDPCQACGGKRLNSDALGYQVASQTLADMHALEVFEAEKLLARFEPRTVQGRLIREELLCRLQYLCRVGLGYLTLDRQARTLSGGEAQRVTLTAALGTSLHNALFVIDEPTVGLHASDILPLTSLFSELAERGNTVLVIEHDPSVILAADRVIELGPQAGQAGGEIVADGTPVQVIAKTTATARAVRHVARRTRMLRTPTDYLEITGATANNLKALDVRIPTGVLSVITGPSGSGKSTLAVEILYRTLARRFGETDVESPGTTLGLQSPKSVQSVVLVDQSPLGRTSRGNAATYTKAWDFIRARLAAQPEAVVNGLSASDFSFNVSGGRCEACSGEGFETVEMQFLADVRLLCPVCQGKRFSESVLGVKLKGRNVAELLSESVAATLQLFDDERQVQRRLGPLAYLGMGYLPLGQALSTLSGGEAQRLKLSRALAEVKPGVLFVLDEPSAGLHADEVEHVLKGVDALLDAGASVLLVEHDLGIIRNADYLIELGPGGGANGGQVLATGTPEHIEAVDCPTGRALLAAKKSHTQARLAKKITKKSAVSSARVLEVVSAREHNLKGVSVKIPHDALTVVTGPSGSGKSTLAFDVIFAEGQRRFLETLTPYARQFLPNMPRPDVDRVVGVPPSIALEQRTTRSSKKSTVATVTEAGHYLRLLFAKLGTAHCPEHDAAIAPSSLESVLKSIVSRRGRVSLLAPVVEDRKGTYLDVFAAAARAGVAHAVCDGQRVETAAPPRLARTREHAIDLLFAEDFSANSLPRAELERALFWGHGSVKLRTSQGDELFSTKLACPICGFAIPKLDPRWFSFNALQGKCATCDGDGVLEVGVKQKKGVSPVVRVCSDCGGSRLAPIPRSVRVNGYRFHEFCNLSVGEAREAVRGLAAPGEQALILQPIKAELARRLQFLGDVGLDYLALGRPALTLSGGELQRLRLAAQLGAGLTGALYVLDEPTIGLHPRDTGRLLKNLHSLVALGSTVLVVEHDEETIRAADFLIDVGPCGGAEGGQIVAAGSAQSVLENPESPTGRALSSPPECRVARSLEESAWLELRGVSEHNLQSVDVRFAKGRFNAVAGVSGSGKSTLVRQVLLPALRQKLKLETEAPGKFKTLRGIDGIVRACVVDQSPIGRTPRSTPATFLGIFDAIRALFAQAPEAQVEGFGPARFSFNSNAGGRCEVCEGQGFITHEMSFLPDVVTPCGACEGQRFEARTLKVRWAGLNIGQVLKLTAEQASGFFAQHPAIMQPLWTLCELGAGYIALGQGSHTLSGGEAQRLKLAAELTASRRHEPTLYVLDEPTTGLHLSDVGKLIRVLDRLVERGDTLVVIEHHPLVLAGADYLVELGPEGGKGGGRIVAAGTPKEVSRLKTATAPVLKRQLAAISVSGRALGSRARSRG